MQQTHEEARVALEQAAAVMKKYYDRHRGESIPYKPGDRVMLEGTFIRTDQPMKKLGDKRYGPFVVDHKVGSSAYWL